MSSTNVLPDQRYSRLPHVPPNHKPVTQRNRAFSRWYVSYTKYELGIKIDRIHGLITRNIPPSKLANPLSFEKVRQRDSVPHTVRSVLNHNEEAAKRACLLKNFARSHGLKTFPQQLVLLARNGLNMFELMKT